MKTMRVKLTSARVGQSFDAKNRPTGFFAQAIGDEVDMPEDEAKRYVERGLASLVDTKTSK